MWRVTNIPGKLRCDCTRRLQQCVRCTWIEHGTGRRGNTTDAAPPPPQPPTGGFLSFVVKAAGVTVLASGGVLAYAWYDKDFKQTLEHKVPYAKDAFGYIFPYLPDSTKRKVVKTRAIEGGTSREEEVGLASRQINRAVQESGPVVKEEQKVNPKTLEKMKKEEKLALEKMKKEEKERKKKEEEKKKVELVKQRIKEQEQEEAAENAAIEKILLDNLSAVEIAVSAAQDAEKRAALAIQTHSQQLKAALEGGSKVLDKEALWDCVTGTNEARLEAITAVEELTPKAKLELEKLKKAIESGKKSKVTKRNAVLMSAQETYSKLNYDLGSAVAEHKKAQSQAKLMSDYKDLVEKGRKQFQKELDSILPDVKLGRKGRKLTEEELNSMIAHAHRRIEQLQRQLAEQLALEQQRTEEALERQKEVDEKLAEGLVTREKEKMKNEFSIQQQKLDTEARAAFELELRKQLGRQAAAHSDHLSQVLKVQQQELEQHFEGVLHDKILDEREKFHLEVAGLIARLRGIEAAIEGRAELEDQARKAQQLWLACVSLQNTIELGRESTEDWDHNLVPLQDEMTAIRDSGSNHPFVNTLLESIPPEGVTNGVWTEECLKERFTRVRRICRRVAMVDETGGSLFQYCLSFVQSLFVFSVAKPLEEDKDISEDRLNLFVLLDNAQHSLEKGDLEQAIRYVNNLRGEPRLIASDWLREARLLLETKQAVEALTAYASASGVGSLH